MGVPATRAFFLVVFFFFLVGRLLSMVVGDGRPCRWGAVTFEVLAKPLGQGQVSRKGECCDCWQCTGGAEGGP